MCVGVECFGWFLIEGSDLVGLLSAIDTELLSRRFPHQYTEYRVQSDNNQLFESPMCVCVSNKQIHLSLSYRPIKAANTSNITADR